MHSRLSLPPTSSSLPIAQQLAVSSPPAVASSVPDLDASFLRLQPELACGLQPEIVVGRKWIIR